MLKSAKPTQFFKMKVLRQAFLPVFTLFGIFTFAYWYPRMLVRLLGEHSIWISYLYTYGLGLLFFILSVIWIFTRRPIDPMRRKEEIKWCIILCCSLVFMFCLYGLWIFIAGQIPVKG